MTSGPQPQQTWPVARSERQWLAYVRTSLGRGVPASALVAELTMTGMLPWQAQAYVGAQLASLRKRAQLTAFVGAAVTVVGVLLFLSIPRGLPTRVWTDQAEGAAVPLVLGLSLVAIGAWRRSRLRVEG